MTEEAADLWARARQAILTSRVIARSDPDAAASRAYYAAYYAVSALFALEGKTFGRHSALEASVHRDLVKSGRWSNSLGREYSFLRGLRSTGDYGGGMHVSESDAAEAILAAERIIEAVEALHPEDLDLP